MSQFTHPKGRLAVVATLMLALAGSAGAHVQVLAPNGGEQIEAGTVFTITWRIQIAHNLQNWDVWYSTSGANGPWIPIAMNLPAGDTSQGSIHTYDWTIPDALSGQCRVRVRMDNTGTDYEDISNSDFSIVGVPLDGFEMVTGALLSGAVTDLENSDNAYVHTRSGFGATLIDLHHMELIVNATTAVESTASMELTIESRIDQPAGIAQVRMRNWTTNDFDFAGQYAIGTTEEIETFFMDAADLVDTNGRMDVSIKHIVFVPFLAFTFESFIDHVQIVVQ